MVPPLAVVVSIVFLQFFGCTKGPTCSYTLGNSTINFVDDQGVWNITSIVCDGTQLNRNFTKEDTGFGSCDEMGATDYDRYWMFVMGSLCYPNFSKLLAAKASVAYTTPFFNYTTYVSAGR